MDKALGRTVRFYRLTLGHSLRSMALNCPFSHTLLGTIEQGYPLLLDNHLEALKSFFKMPMTYESVPFEQFIELEKSALNAFVFFQEETLLERLEFLKKAQEEYLHSAYAFDYYFLVKGLCMLLHRVQFARFTGQEMTVLEQIEPLMRPYQKQLFSLIKSRTFLQKSKIKQAIYVLETDSFKDKDTLLEGIYYRQLSQLYTLTFFHNKAEESNLKAKSVFERTHNYRRLQESQLRFTFIQLVKRKDPLAYEFIELLETCAQQAFQNLHIECLRVQTYIKIISQIESFDVTSKHAHDWEDIVSEIIHLYQAYTRDTNLSVQGPFARIHFYEEGLKALLSPQDEDALKTYYTLTLEANLAFENSLAYTLYVNYLSNKRRFKDCLLMSEKRLKLIQEG